MMVMIWAMVRMIFNIGVESSICIEVSGPCSCISSSTDHRFSFNSHAHLILS